MLATATRRSSRSRGRMAARSPRPRTLPPERRSSRQEHAPVGDGSSVFVVGVRLDPFVD
jgi:hypothetical protein